MGESYRLRQGGRAARIDKDLRELGKQDREQRLDLIFVACDFIGELARYPHQFTVSGDHLRRDVAAAGFTTQEHARNRDRIDAVGFRPQAPLQRKLVGLARMQQAHLVALGLQKAMEGLPRLGRLLPGQ